MNTIYRIFIEPLPQSDLVSDLQLFIDKQTEYSKKINLKTSNLDFTYINKDVEETRNKFFFDMLLAILNIRKKAKSGDEVFLYFRSMVDRRGIRTSWASVISHKQIVFFTKLFQGDYKVNCIFDLPNKKYPSDSIIFRKRFEEIIKDENLYFNESDLQHFTNLVLRHANAKENKKKAITQLIKKVNDLENPQIEVNLNFYDHINENYPLTKFYFERETSDFEIRPNSIRIFDI